METTWTLCPSLKDTRLTLTDEDINRRMSVLHCVARRQVTEKSPTTGISVSIIKKIECINELS